MSIPSNDYTTGSLEYISVTVTANVLLDTQPVVISLDSGVTWLTATWLGQAGTSRTTRTAVPVALTASGGVRVKVTDNPEIPIMRAGRITVS